MTRATSSATLQRIHRRSMSRRDWLKAGIASLGAARLDPAAAPTARRSEGETYSFHHDHILGTLLDLCVATPGEAVAEAAERVVRNEIERLRLVLSQYDPTEEIKNRSGQTYCAWKGPTVWIEYAPQDGTDPIHTVARNPRDDYGAGLLKRGTGERGRQPLWLAQTGG